MPCDFIKTICTSFTLLLVLLANSSPVLAQGAPVTGSVQLDVGGVITGELGATVIVPVNIDLTAVTAVDSNNMTVPAVLGNYRIVIRYDNTLLKAKLVSGAVSGGTTTEFSAPAMAHIITDATTDSLIVMHTQLNNVAPFGVINVAQIEFEILSALSATASINATIVDLRTPIIFTGIADSPVIGGENMQSIVSNGSVSIVPATDADNDGMPDVWELAVGLNPSDPTDALLDPDDDGLNNLAEYLNNTELLIADTDNDLVPDGAEVAAGKNPNDITDFPLWIISNPVITALESNIYQYTSVANYSGSTFTLDVPPVGMTIDSITGLIDWLPASGQIGVNNVAIRVTNGIEVATQNYIVIVYALGDINIDGVIDVADYWMVQRHLLGLSVLDAQETKRADVYPLTNGDSEITASDLMLILRKIIGP